MMNKSELEVNVAYMVAEGFGDWDDAKRSAEIQGLSFDAIKRVYGRIYEKEQCNDAGFNHG